MRFLICYTVIGQHRSTQRKPRTRRLDEDALTTAIIKLAERFGRYGYRRITALLRTDGWHVNEKRVYRLGRQKSIINRFSGQRRREGVRKISNRSRIDGLTNGSNEATKEKPFMAE